MLDAMDSPAYGPMEYDRPGVLLMGAR